MHFVFGSSFECIWSGHSSGSVSDAMTRWQDRLVQNLKWRVPTLNNCVVLDVPTLQEYVSIHIEICLKEQIQDSGGHMYCHQPLRYLFKEKIICSETWLQCLMCHQLPRFIFKNHLEALVCMLFMCVVPETLKRASTLLGGS